MKISAPNCAVGVAWVDDTAGAAGVFVSVVVVSVAGVDGVGDALDEVTAVVGAAGTSAEEGGDTSRVDAVLVLGGGAVSSLFGTAGAGTAVAGAVVVGAVVVGAVVPRIDVVETSVVVTSVAATSVVAGERVVDGSSPCSLARLLGDEPHAANKTAQATTVARNVRLRRVASARTRRALTLLRNRSLGFVCGDVSLREQLDDLFFELIDHATQRQDVEHALATLEKVDDLFAATNERWLTAVHNEVRGCDVFAELILEVGKDLSDLLETNARVEEVLHDFQLEQVPVAIPTSRATSCSVGHRWPNQVGTGPVVELAVGDTNNLGGLLSAIANVLIDAVVHVRSPFGSLPR